MPDEIQPALAPEEWARLPRSVGIAGMPNILDRPILTGDWAVVVALANAALPNNDPRKITREDLFGLHEVIANFSAAYLRDDQSATFGYDRLANYRNLAQALEAKLSALLPPDVSAS